MCVHACVCVCTRVCFHHHRPDLLVRAARHYEGAGQVLLRQAVMSAQEFVSIGQGEMPPIGEWQEVECPARLDLSGKSAPVHKLNHWDTLYLRMST